jgi:hypothetical protein
VSIKPEPVSIEAEQLALPEDRDLLREDISRHLAALRLPIGETNNGTTKAMIRASHARQRESVFRREYGSLRSRARDLLFRFADGNEVEPTKVEPRLIPVRSDTQDGDLFRLATLLWSVPVSRGYGRRMRYLVVDDNNGKLMGLFALGDPVFNLGARDAWVGWTVRQRERHLVHLMDAFILGAVPPYAQLLGGKVIASLIGSAEIGRAFDVKYSGTTGIISQIEKKARLVMVTVTSALGRSSLYNRLVLHTEPFDPKSRVLVRLDRIGSTTGYGHFQLSDELFARLRRVLREGNHPYAGGHQYGQGPNWRMRVIRAGLQALEIDPELLKHGILRDVYVMPLASNAREYLRDEAAEPTFERPSLATIAEAARERWIVPRSLRDEQFRSFKRTELLAVLGDSRANGPWAGNSDDM